METNTTSPQSKPDLPVPNKIRLGYSDIHFRGVFATEDIEEGEIIERCPAVVLAWRTNYQKDPVVWAYMYTNSCPCEECKRHGAHFVMVMGWGQMYNHQDNNNASMNINIKDSLADVIARRKIKKGEEIFVSYGDKYFNGRNKLTVSSPGEEYTGGPQNPMESTKVIKPL
jgi:hypothetical protein